MGAAKGDMLTEHRDQVIPQGDTLAVTPATDRGAGAPGGVVAPSDEVDLMREICRRAAEVVRRGPNLVEIVAVLLPELSAVTQRLGEQVSVAAEGIEIDLARSEVAGLKSEMAAARKALRDEDSADASVCSHLQAALQHAFCALDWIEQPVSTMERDAGSSV
jgi:hypothetical protein